MDENPRIADLRKKLEKDPGSRLFAQLAEELRKDGKLEEAIAVARRGLEKNPNYPSARLTLARALLDSGRPREARPELEQVVKASPDNILAGRLLGDALEDLGQVPEAIKQIERTLVFSPGDKPMTEKLGLLRASLVAMQETEARQAAAVAAPLASVPAPEPVPEVVTSVALDRDLASGTFSPGSLMAADLQRHFEIQAAEPPAPDAVPDVLVEQTLGFGQAEASAFAMDTADTLSLEPTAAPGDTDRTQLFAAVPVPVPEPTPVAPPEIPQPGILTESGLPYSERPEAMLPAAVPEADDIGGQTLPLTSLTLADLYLQQGLKAEASAVLSQVVKDEPDNAQARSRLAAVSDDLAQPVVETEVPQAEAGAPAAAVVEPWTMPAPEPVPEPVPAPVAEVAPPPPPVPNVVPPVAAAPIQKPVAPLLVDLPVPPRPLTRSEIRERTILSLTAFKDAAEREAIHQRASEFSIRQEARRP